MIITKVYGIDKVYTYNLPVNKLPDDCKSCPAMEEANSILTETINFNGWELKDNNGSYWLIDPQKQMRDFPCRTNFHSIVKYENFGIG